MKHLSGKLNLLFYILLIYSFIIFVLPHSMTMAVYTPNILGWSMFTTFLLAIIIYFTLLIIDITQKRAKKELLKRSITLLIILIVSVLYWFYKAIKAGNLEI